MTIKLPSKKERMAEHLRSAAFGIRNVFTHLSDAENLARDCMPFEVANAIRNYNQRLNQLLIDQNDGQSFFDYQAEVEEVVRKNPDD